MTSINTNLAAVSALRTLQATNTALDATQSRISTGLKIGEAKDNAAYWSISTSLKSDNKAMATVKDALNLGAATVDTAYQGLNATIDVLNEIKSKLTAATQDGVDKTAVQAEITELVAQIKSIANSSSFSNENWLNVAATGTKSVVASYNTDAAGTVSIGTINVDTANTALYVGTTGGVMQTKTTLAQQASTALTFTPGTAGANLTFDDAGDKIEFTLTLEGGSAKTITINQAAIQAAGDKDTAIDDKDELVAIINNLIAADNDLKGNVTASYTSSNIVFTTSSAKTVAVSAATVTEGTTGGATDLAGGNFAFAAVTAASNTKALEASVSTISIANATAATIKSYIQIVNSTIDSVTTAAANLGAVAKRIDLQSTFVQNLMDTIDKGVSGLIDADMNEESTKLQALQVKQQLGVQALSIANQSAQNVLSLFRG